MANLMNIFTKNFSSINTLLQIKKDATEIKKSLMTTYQNTSVRASNIRRNNKYIRSVFSWFGYHDDENDEHSSLFRENDDEFDAGFHYATDDSQESSSVMDADSMQSISNETTREMFKIGRKKIESNLQILSEIVTVVDDRSSEIIASLRTIDTSTRIIADKLALIARGMETGITRANKKDFSYKGMLQNDIGRLTLSSISEFAKKNEEHVTKTFIQSLMDVTGVGMLDKQLNETIQSYQHSFLEKFLDLPLLRKYYRTDRVSSNYEFSITSDYDRTQAIFDGMTRKSIISVIPDYLREITNAVTGIRLNISNSGSLTTQDIDDKFVKSIDVTFDTSAFNSRRLDKFIEESSKKDDKIDSADLREVLKLMIEQYVGQVYLHSTRNHFRASQLENGGDKGLHRHIAVLLKKTKGKTLGYWMNLIEIHSAKFISDKHYRIDFASAINKALNNLDEAARRNIKNSRKVTNTQFTQEMFDERAIARLKIDSSRFEHEGKTLRQLIREKVISIESLTEKELANLDKPITTFADLNERLEASSTEVTSNFLNDLQTQKFERVKQIFDLLNSVINVYFVDKIFGKMKPRKTKQKKTTKTTTNQSPQSQQQTRDTTETKDVEQTEETPPEIQPHIESTSSEEDSSPSYDPTLKPINEMPSIKIPVKENDDDIEQVSEISSILSASKGEPTIVNFVSSQISSIKDIGLQQTLKTIVTSSIDRSGKKDEKKSPFGKGLFFVLGLAKSFFSKIFSGIKSFLTLKRKLLVKLLSPAIEKMKTGAAALKEGLFGSDDSVGVIKDIKNKISEKKEERRIKKLESSLQPIDEAPKKQKMKQQKQTTSKSEEKKTNSIQEQFENSKIGKSIKSFNTKITDKLKSSEFGRGFLSAFDKSESKIVGTSLFDKSSDGIQDILTRPSSLTEGVILSIMRSFDYINEQADAFMDKLNEKTETEIEDKQKKKKETEEKKQKEEQQKQEQAQAKKKPTGIAFAVGKMLGGLMGILSGLMQAVTTIVVSMVGLKKITTLIHKTLTSILKPLNKAFNSIYKALRPAMKTIQNVLKQLVEFIVQIVESVVMIIQPILELIGPLLEQIMSVLEPILEMVTGLVNVLMVPLTAVMQTVVVPLIQGIANSIEVIFGIVQVGLGSILITTGALMVAVGAIGKVFGAGSLFDSGANVMTLGTNMVKSGASSVISGMQKQVSLIGSLMTGEINRTQEESDQETNQEQRRRKNVVNTLNGSPMDGIYGSGDANAPYKFDDNVLDALETLRSLSSGIISLFTGETDTETKLESAKDREAYAKAQMDTVDLSDEKRKEIDDRAFQMFKQTINNEQLIGETDEQYRARYEANKEKYWAKAATEILREKVKSVADGSDEGAVAMTNSALGLNEDDRFAKMLMDYDNSTEEGSAITAMADFVNSMSYSDDDGYYDDEYYYEGGTGDIFQAAAEVFTVARKTAGGDLHWNGTSITNLRFSDGMVIDRISPTHCTSMMTAIVKRMGYYVPGNQASYSDTYQGTDQLVATAGGHGALSWGLQSSDGHPNIYDRDGKVSEDWITGVGNPQPGDITFGGIGGNIHAHMGVYTGADGNWFGFNGGADDSLASSVKLGEYYLKHGTFPTDTRVNVLPGKWCNDHAWTDQIGAIAPPMTYWVRYVGPKSKGKRRRVKRSGGGSSSGGLGIGGSKEDWIKTVAMMFEGYYYNGDKYYDNKNTHTFKIRDGRTVKARPDCSGMLGAAMTAFGYTLDYPPSSSHYNVTGSNGNLNFIHDPDGSVSKDWKLIKFTGNNLEPGDITGNTAHASFPVTNLTAPFPGGFDAGGTENIAQSAKAARALLDGKSDIPWRSAMGSGSFTSVGGAKNIVRYVGGGSSKSSSSSSSKRRIVSSKPTSSKTSTPKITTTRKTNTSSAKTSTNGKEALIESASEIFEAYQKTNPALTYSNGLWSKSIRTRSGHTRQIRPDCSGTLSAAIQELGYTLRDLNGNDVGDIGLRSGTWGSQTKNTLIFDSPTAKTPSKDWTVLEYSKAKLQRGDIVAYPPPPGKASGHLSMPIVDLTSSPRGLDGGGGIQKSPAAAVAYLAGKPDSQIPWVTNGGMSNMKKIWRYKGTTSVASANAISRSKQTAKTKSTALATTKKKTTTKKKITRSKSTALKGGTTEAKIFNYLTGSAGMSKKGAAGMMGCMKYESGMKPNNLEDSYNAKFGMSDEQYTSAVDSKKESKSQFMYGRYATYISGQTPGEAVGYGLTQFTSSDLKRRLYEKTVEKGKSIADIGAQMDATVDTLKSRKVGSSTLFQTIKNAKTPTEANKWFLWRYEAGTGYNSDEAVARAYPWMGMKGVNDRHQAAESYYKTYGSGDEAYDTSAFDLPYDEQPMIDFVSNPNMFDGNDSDYISADPFEDIPYNPNPGPMIIPELPPIPIDEQPQMPTIINKYKFVNGLEALTQYIDEFLVNEYDVQSVEIRSLVDQIYDEFPEYIEDYFDDDDDEFTVEDDLLIQDMASVFL